MNNKPKSRQPKSNGKATEKATEKNLTTYHD